MGRQVLVIATLALAVLLTARAGVATAPAAAPPIAWSWAGDGLPEQSTGLALAGNGTLHLTAMAAPAAELPYTRAGSLVSARLPLGASTAVVEAEWQGEAPAGTAVRLEVRGWSDGGRATPWVEAAGAASLVQLAWPATAVQYRLTLLALPDAPGPIVRAVTLRPAPSAPGEPVLTAQAQPATSVRVYATRIGLIGGTTANGHMIAAEDRFVALPSRRVLAERNGREYEVQVEYKGRRLTLPVWDVGPWNVRDNYWATSTRRDMWNDLPTGQPQAAAAYYEAYNGGRDGFGRRVLSPAGIDLSDAAFAELGMTQPDWVTVTFLWQMADR